MLASAARKSAANCACWRFRYHLTKGRIQNFFCGDVLGKIHHSGGRLSAGMRPPSGRSCCRCPLVNSQRRQASSPMIVKFVTYPPLVYSRNVRASGVSTRSTSLRQSGYRWTSLDDGPDGLDRARQHGFQMGCRHISSRCIQPNFSFQAFQVGGVDPFFRITAAAADIPVDQHGGKISKAHLDVVAPRRRRRTCPAPAGCRGRRSFGTDMGSFHDGCLLFLQGSGPSGLR